MRIVEHGAIKLGGGVYVGTPDRYEDYLENAKWLDRYLENTLDKPYWCYSEYAEVNGVEKLSVIGVTAVSNARDIADVRKYYVGTNVGFIGIFRKQLIKNRGDWFDKFKETATKEPTTINQDGFLTPCDNDAYICKLYIDGETLIAVEIEINPCDPTPDGVTVVEVGNEDVFQQKAEIVPAQVLNEAVTFKWKGNVLDPQFLSSNKKINVYTFNNQIKKIEILFEENTYDENPPE